MMLGDDETVFVYLQCYQLISIIAPRLRQYLTP